MQSKNTLKVHFSKSLLLFPWNVQEQLELGLQFNILLTCWKRRCYYSAARGKSGDDLFECTFWIDIIRAFIMPPRSDLLSLCVDFARWIVYGVRAGRILMSPKRVTEPDKLLRRELLRSPLSNRSAMFSLIALFAGFTPSRIFGWIKIRGKRNKNLH